MKIEPLNSRGDKWMYTLLVPHQHFLIRGLIFAWNEGFLWREKRYGINDKNSFVRTNAPSPNFVTRLIVFSKKSIHLRACKLHFFSYYIKKIGTNGPLTRAVAPKMVHNLHLLHDILNFHLIEDAFKKIPFHTSWRELHWDDVAKKR